jgi:hypothetical protein
VAPHVPLGRRRRQLPIATRESLRIEPLNYPARPLAQNTDPGVGFGIWKLGLETRSNSRIINNKFSLADRVRGICAAPAAVPNVTDGEMIESHWGAEGRGDGSFSQRYGVFHIERNSGKKVSKKCQKSVKKVSKKMTGNS